SLEKDHTRGSACLRVECDGTRDGVPVNLRVDIRPGRPRTLRVRADVDRVEWEASRIHRVDIVADDLDIKRRLTGVDGWPTEFRAVNAAAVRRVFDGVVLDGHRGGLLALHDDTQAVTLSRSHS